MTRPRLTTVHHYKSNPRDIAFNLFEVLDIASNTLAAERFNHLDSATAEQLLDELRKLCETSLAESFADADRQGVQFDGEGNVTLPESLKRSMSDFWAGGWHLLGLPLELGGGGAPPSLAWAAHEYALGANPAVSFYCFGNVVAHTIARLGTEKQKARFVEPMIAQNWGGTMVLTEPGAGSDVGAGRTKAKHIEGDVWEIEGVKRFISQGDFDAVDNIVHLVLARPEGGQMGTKGLSMFIVPKFWVHEDGTLGERNGAFCTNVEKKMGLNASATCEMTFGDRMPCRGLLVGEVPEGIRQMFHVIEHARMAIGVKATSTLSTGYLNALAYAKERVQGPDLAKAADKTSPRVRIIEHPDVRRMLMLQKAWAEGMRALYFFTAHLQDKVEIAGGHGHPDAKQLDRLNDLMLPILKGVFSETCYEVLASSLQCFGGSGYCRDYPIEQYIRDAKIDTLYEGTTHIQALDLFFRKIARDGGQTLRTLMGQVQKTAKPQGDDDPLAIERAALADALADVNAMFATMLGKLNDSLYHVGFQGNRLLMTLGKLVVGWQLIHHAEIAHARLGDASDSDRAFYEGRIASARFFAREVMPDIKTARAVVEKSSVDLMDLAEASF